MAEYFEGDRSFGSKWRRYLERKTAPSAESYRLILDKAATVPGLKAELHSFYTSPFWQALSFTPGQPIENAQRMAFYKTLPAKLQSHLLKKATGNDEADRNGIPILSCSLEAITDVADLNALAALIVLATQGQEAGLYFRAKVKLKLFNLLLYFLRSSPFHYFYYEIFCLVKTLSFTEEQPDFADYAKDSLWLSSQDEIRNFIRMDGIIISMVKEAALITTEQEDRDFLTLHNKSGNSFLEIILNTSPSSESDIRLRKMYITTLNRKRPKHRHIPLGS
ncbi:hypothetical protein WH43_00090 [Rheinheimera sp. KL1]|uniref:hypothetical protein n=1 Tax=Rheinheimera sp. KL1 TaxID=1635005 RepID=UPI0006A98BBA|nr:hypothetical protein [Rheinheimera sp. KL1]KOO60064.1 hypothetical protein WH43_00090 [Rheinheimera sp. KL1]